MFILRGGMKMNRTVTSKEELLEAAKRIALEEGIESLSIRRLAAECRVSVGVIYNYYSGKSDLVLGVVEEFWRRVFHREGDCMDSGQGFVEFFSLAYGNAFENLKTFRQALLWQLDDLKDGEKEKGKQMEAAYFQHMQSGLLGILKMDDRIPETVWTAGFSQEKFVRFVFMNMLAMLKSGVSDIHFFEELLKRILYIRE